MVDNSILNTKLVSEWNVAKNGNLKIENFTLGSNKKVWWKCSKGHEWEAIIRSRHTGSGCPYCSNKKISEDNNLLIRFPQIAIEWDDEKNLVKASEVFPGNVIKFWWKCPSGHSYQSSPNKRTSSNRGCPYCSGRLVSDKNSLVVLFPNIIKEFDVSRNIGVNINELTIKSHKKIWWKCKKGHEWEANIANRTRGDNCPYCNTQVSKNELRIYSELKAFFKDVTLKRKIDGYECDILIPSLNIAIEYDGVFWHANNVARDKKKNVGLNQAGITLIRIRELGLDKLADIDLIYDFKKESILIPIKYVLKVISNNEKIGEELYDRIFEYNNASDFINEQEYRGLLERLPSPIEGDSLQAKYPLLTNEWHKIKNKGLTPLDVSSKSSLKVWWKCEKGHEWEGSIGNRTQGGNGCPYCTHQLITFENSIAYVRPDLILEWDEDKNGGVTADKIFAYSSILAWWKCKIGHHWEARPSNRCSLGKGKNTGCPYCSNRKINSENSLSSTQPLLTEEWNYEKNIDITPHNVGKGSEKKVWWKCKKGHEWEANINARVRGNGCPYCSNQKISRENSLEYFYPEVAKQWHPDKNKDILPINTAPKSSKKAWWICSKGHEWEASVGHRTNLGSGCPYCSNQKACYENCLKTNYPEISKEWNVAKNGKLTPNDVTKQSSKLVWWKCSKGHEWEAKIVYRVNGRYKCSKCKSNVKQKTLNYC